MGVIILQTFETLLTNLENGENFTHQIESYYKF